MLTTAEMIRLRSEGKATVLSRDMPVLKAVIVPEEEQLARLGVAQLDRLVIEQTQVVADRESDLKQLEGAWANEVATAQVLVDTLVRVGGVSSERVNGAKAALAETKLRTEVLRAAEVRQRDEARKRLAVLQKAVSIACSNDPVACAAARGRRGERKDAIVGGEATPMWAWLAGGGLVVAGLLMFARGRG